MSIGIYKITNKINKCAYIGQSINIKKRQNDHKNYPSECSHYPLYKAFKDFGIENFNFEIIEECALNQLNDREKYWIAYYDTFYKGYNQTKGGAGTLGVQIKISEEDLEIIYDLLLHSSITQREIAKQFDVGEDTISDINNGKSRINPKFKYPIRDYKNQQKYCPLCGVPILHESSHCFKCSNLIRRTVKNRPTREELKNLIRTTSFLKIGEQYGISDNGVRKWCVLENLPRTKKEIKSYSDEEWQKI